MAMLSNIFRALRLPFIFASILPFVFGSLIAKQHFNLIVFLLGVSVVAATHLSANLINDYADSRSGADWQDKGFYKFFGGSKLIQEGILSEGFYLKAAVLMVCIAVSWVVLLALFLNKPAVLGLYLIIVFLGWSYSSRPLQLSYRMCGEPVVFLLFGPALVMGGYFIQTGIFPDSKSLLLSLPFGFLTVAILFANEVPDYYTDKKVGKLTWVNLLGEKRSYILYSLLVLSGFLSILVAIILGYLGLKAGVSFVLLLPAIRAAYILKRYLGEKERLAESSKLTIAIQGLAGIILILDRLL